MNHRGGGGGGVHPADNRVHDHGWALSFCLAGKDSMVNAQQDYENSSYPPT